MQQQTIEILEIFEQINAIPRASKNEQAISAWLARWGEQRGLVTRSDKWGNVVIEVPGTGGYEDAPVVVLQGHMDMVCEKTPDSNHDFSKDPIRPLIDGDWLTADRTTLGADNGIAIAMGLALAGSKTAAHPPLELLFTVDEEQGMTGAANMEPGFVSGKVMLNLDSEDEGVFTIGCSGGRETVIEAQLEMQPLPEGMEVCSLKVSGLNGGHSGVDIGKHRACANKLLARALYHIQRSCPLRLVGLDGGTAHNAIPREAAGFFAVKKGDSDSLVKIVKEFENELKSEFAAIESSLSLTLEQADNKGVEAVAEQDSHRAVLMLNAVPHGVVSMSADVEGKVETSTSFATLKLDDGKLEVLTSQRSSVMSRLDAISSEVASIATLAGAAFRFGNQYPSWPANIKSPLITRCSEVYNRMFGREPVFEIIHAGLECAVIGGTYPEMDMISLGPTIENPHSPDERMNIHSLEKSWEFLLELLKTFKR